MKKQAFQGMEFIFDHIDILYYRKTYLPIFINESLSDVYGIIRKSKRKLKQIKLWLQ
jgi:hypothetical protein